MLNNLAQEIYNNAVTHGWWDKERQFPEIIAQGIRIRIMFADYAT